MPSEITTSERADLERCEKVIEKGRETISRVAEALREIRDRKLYKADYSSFKVYCKHRWGYEERRAYQLIDHARTVEVIEEKLNQGSVNLGRNGAVQVPENERQTRPLMDLPPDKQAEAWEMAVEEAGGGQPTAAQVQEAAQQVNEPEPEEKPEPVTDSEGTEVPERLVQVFTTGTEKINAARKLLLEAQDLLIEASEHGARKLIDSLLSLQKAGDKEKLVCDKIKELRWLLSKLQAHSVCPFCNGKGKGCRVRDKATKAVSRPCDETGYLTKDQHAEAQKALQYTEVS